jgi:hypothetical protein
MRGEILLTAVCVSIAACATRGVEIRPEQLEAFKPGVTTMAEVTAQLGRPTNTTSASDGTHSIMYVFAHVGFAGMNTRSSAVMLTFDADNKLLRYTTSQNKL